MIKNRIKEYRARYDMKQEELAARVGVRRKGEVQSFACSGLEYRKGLRRHDRGTIYRG